MINYLDIQDADIIFKNRQLLLSGDINTEVVNKIIKDILDINYFDDVNEAGIRDYVRKPIVLYINSPGGNVSDGLALYDIIRTSVTPICTIAIGAAMSMGLWLFMAGDIRLIGENATLMYHEISTAIQDKTEGIALEVAESKRLQKIYDKTITSNSKITQSQLEDYKKRKAEWYISPKEAIKLGLADDYFRLEPAKSRIKIEK